MKRLMVLVTALILLIPLARTALAAPARETTPKTNVNVTRLFVQGTMQSNETSVTVFPTMSITAVGTGDATQLGHFTISYHTEVNLLDLSVVETAQWNGTSGNTLNIKAVGQATEDRTPGMLKLIEIYTITGGSGRLTGVSGTLTVNRVVSATTGVTSSTFEGYLLLPWN